MSDDRAPLSERAYAILRRKLVTCELYPGQWVSEAELQDHAGLPRTPTREATMRLVNEGMLVVYPRRGYRAAEITNQLAAQLFDVFEVLMASAASNARGRVDPETFTRVNEVIDSGRQTSGGDRLSILLDASELLLPTIVDAAQNPWLTDISLRLFSHVERLWAFAFTDESIDALIDGGFAPIIRYMQRGTDDPVPSRERFVGANSWVREHTLQAVERHLLQLDESAGRAAITG